MQLFGKPAAAVFGTASPAVKKEEKKQEEEEDEDEVCLVSAWL